MGYRNFCSEATEISVTHSTEISVTHTTEISVKSSAKAEDTSCMFCKFLDVFENFRNLDF